MAEAALKRIPIDSRQRWNDTGVDVVKGVLYDVTVTGQWCDAKEPCGPEGWPGNRFINLFTLLRRARQFRWAALVGSVDQRKPYVHVMPGVIKAPATGRLFCFFNDARGFYWNNSGKLVITINGIPEDRP